MQSVNIVFIQSKFINAGIQLLQNQKIKRKLFLVISHLRKVHFLPVIKMFGEVDYCFVIFANTLQKYSQTFLDDFILQVLEHKEYKVVEMRSQGQNTGQTVDHRLLIIDLVESCHKMVPKSPQKGSQLSLLLAKAGDIVQNILKGLTSSLKHTVRLLLHYDTVKSPKVILHGEIL